MGLQAGSQRAGVCGFYCAPVSLLVCALASIWVGTCYRVCVCALACLCLHACACRPMQQIAGSAVACPTVHAGAMQPLLHAWCADIVIGCCCWRWQQRWASAATVQVCSPSNEGVSVLGSVLGSASNKGISVLGSVLGSASNEGISVLGSACFMINICSQRAQP